MQRRVESALVAKVGTFVFAGILGLPVTLPASGGQMSPIVASATSSRDASLVALFDLSTELADMRALVRSSPVSRSAEEIDLPGAGSATSSATPGEATGPAAPEPVAPPLAVPRPTVVTPTVSGTIVLASWYGPGFYGNRTACGLTLTPEIIGVAHLTLPCGTRVTLSSPAGRTLTVPVIDRGPYVAGRTLDLSYATKVALGCSDLCSVRMAIGP